MTILGALAGGFVGALLLTTGMRAATELRAQAAGYALHFLFGLLFAGVYCSIFAAVDEASWWFGALLGLVYALFAGTALVSILLPLVHPRMATMMSDARSTPLLEPPGFMLLNYGRSTPAVMIAVHLVYGAVVGAFGA